MIDINGFCLWLYEEELSPNTIEVYRTGVKQFAKMFDNITKTNVIEWKKHLSNNFCASTVNLRLTAIMKYCAYKEIPLKVKQIKEAKKTHIDNVISIAQYQRLCESLKNEQNMRWYYYILILAKTGMRISEALKVRKKDIINGSVTMATKAHMRTIFFPKSLKNDIAPLLESLSDDDLILQNRTGKPLTSRGFAQMLQNFAQKYNIPKEVMHPHSFRHFFAIEFLKRNANIALLADLLGHGSVNVTQIYLRQSKEEQQQSIDDAVDW